MLVVILIFSAAAVDDTIPIIELCLFTATALCHHVNKLAQIMTLCKEERLSMAGVTGIPVIRSGDRKFEIQVK